MNSDVAILLPDLRGGGAEKVCVDLARGFAERGRSVEIVLLRAEGPWKRAIPAGVNVIDLGASRVRGGFRPLVRYLRSKQPRSMLAAMWPMTSVAVWAARTARVRTRVVVSDHNDLVHTPQGASWHGRLVMRATMRLSYHAASGVIAVSEGVAATIRRLSALPAGRVTVVYNPIEVSPGRLAPADDAAPEWTRADGRRRVIAIGTFKPQKDYPTLLRAFARARHSLDMKLLILGEGPDRNDVERLARDLGIEDLVHMPGFVEKPERYLREADLFVLSSAWEGFGNVIVEALACGVPVVSTDCPSGPREILVDGRFGRLVPVRNEEAFSAAMVGSLTEAHDRDTLIDRARYFSLDRSAEHHLRLLLPELHG